MPWMISHLLLEQDKLKNMHVGQAGQKVLDQVEQMFNLLYWDIFYVLLRDDLQNTWLLLIDFEM